MLLGPLTAAIETSRASGAIAARTRASLGHDRGHRAVARQRAHQPAARGDQRQAVFEAEHAGDAGGHVLADAVAQHRGRSHAPRPPQLGQRVLDREQRRLRVLGRVDRRGRARRAGYKHRQQRLRQACRAAARRSGRALARNTRLRVDTAPRPCPRTATLAGEEERDARRAQAGASPRTRRRPRRLRRCSSSRCGRLGGDAAITATRCAKCARPAFAVNATSASDRAIAPRRSRVRRTQRTQRLLLSRRRRSARAAAARPSEPRPPRCGAASSTTCALVPLKPNELTPAMRRPPVAAGHGVSVVGTRTASSSHGM